MSSLPTESTESSNEEHYEQRYLDALLTTAAYDHKNPYLQDELEDKVMSQIFSQKPLQ